MTLGESGKTIALASGASQTGFGRTGTVDWQTGSIKTGTFTATNGEGYFVNTTGGVATANLPSSPSAGNIVSIKDYTGTFGTNNCTVGRNGSNIRGAASDFLLQKDNSGATFIYVDGTEGWQVYVDGADGDAQLSYMTATGGTVTCCGNYKIHTFTGPGTFTVTALGCAPVNKIEYLMVAGGGGGGSCNGGGGGGGPAIIGACEPVCEQAYPIAVGAGGAAGAGSGVPTGKGTNTTFFGITANAGGGGLTSGNTSCLPAGP